VHTDDDLICAIDIDRYGDTGVQSSLCGKKVQITNTENGNTVTVTIADACPTCTNGNSIDLSVAAFKHLDTLGTGEVPIKWEFV
jgi:expansin (peptidoglycan-binding protein)